MTSVPPTSKGNSPPAQKAMLRDGTPVILRPVMPSDKPYFTKGFAGLSERSRLNRFHSVVNELNENALRYFTEVDYVNHMAWVAIQHMPAGETGIGVGRYVRLPAEPSVAEAALTVVDAHQGRGLGTLLMAALAASAVQSGIETLRGYVRDDNAAMLKIFRKAATVERFDSPGVLQVDMSTRLYLEKMSAHLDR